MSPSRAKLPSMSAALAGLPVGVQPRGPWMGRRQLFVRFASEAETATIYTADALRGELTRLATRSPYHSIAIAGGDPLAEAEFLAVALKEAPALPVMLDHDGQRPEALASLLGALKMVQVTVRGGEGDAALERIGDTLTRAATKGVEHAVAIEPAEAASDAQLLRVVERVHAAEPRCGRGAPPARRPGRCPRPPLARLAREGRRGARRRPAASRGDLASVGRSCCNGCKGFNAEAAEENSEDAEESNSLQAVLCLSSVSSVVKRSCNGI
jgi:hypothetical protein